MRSLGCRFGKFLGLGGVTLLIGLTSSPMGVGAAPLSWDPSRMSSFEGVVEAERQAQVAAQVYGIVLEVNVKPGDRVAQGQVIVRIDSQAAHDTVRSAEAQIRLAQANLEVARKDLERQRLLFEKDYISQAALDRAQARFKAAEAETESVSARTDLTKTQSEFYTIRAPFSGVVSEVPVNAGDMAIAGKPLVTLYDPNRLRLTANVPESSLPPGLSAGQWVIDVPGLSPTRPGYIKVLPTADPNTHTVQVRLGLTHVTSGLLPGTFGRAWLPATGSVSVEKTLWVPDSAIVRRGEVTALYILDPKNQAVLRQVRLGRTVGHQIEVLSGLDPTDQVVQHASNALTGH